MVKYLLANESLKFIIICVLSVILVGAIAKKIEGKPLNYSLLLISLSIVLAIQFITVGHINRWKSSHHCNHLCKEYFGYKCKYLNDRFDIGSKVGIILGGFIDLLYLESPVTKQPFPWYGIITGTLLSSGAFFYIFCGIVVTIINKKYLKVVSILITVVVVFLSGIIIRKKLSSIPWHILPAIVAVVIQFTFMEIMIFLEKKEAWKKDYKDEDFKRGIGGIGGVVGILVATALGMYRGEEIYQAIQEQASKIPGIPK